jgi:hypothetical protein
VARSRTAPLKSSRSSRRRMPAHGRDHHVRKLAHHETSEGETTRAQIQRVRRRVSGREDVGRAGQLDSPHRENLLSKPYTGVRGMFRARGARSKTGKVPV